MNSYKADEKAGQYHGKRVLTRVRRRRRGESSCQVLRLRLRVAGAVVGDGIVEDLGSEIGTVVFAGRQATGGAGYVGMFTRREYLHR